MHIKRHLSCAYRGSRTDTLVLDPVEGKMRKNQKTKKGDQGKAWMCQAHTCTSTPSSFLFDTPGHVSAVDPRGVATTPHGPAAHWLLWDQEVGSVPCMAWLPMGLRGTTHPFPKRNPLSTITRNAALPNDPPGFHSLISNVGNRRGASTGFLLGIQHGSVRGG